MPTRTRPSMACWTRPFSTLPAAALATSSGSRKKMPDAGGERQAEHQRDRALAELHALLGRGHARRADQPARADDERLVQDDEPAHERQSRPARAVESGVEPFGGPHDAAVGMAQRHRDRIATAHEHALDESLATVGESGHAGVSLPSRRERAACRPGHRNGGPEGPPSVSPAGGPRSDQPAART